MNDDRQINRRNFFRNGLRELLKPVVESLDEKFDAVAKALPKPVSLKLLRPPGAVDEDDFLKTCSRCGVCVQACPADAIKIDPGHKIAGGAPYIDANLAPCVVCSTLECMTVCPTGALVPTPIRYIDMGTAAWNASTCLRTKGDGCRVCVDECPVGEVAIRISVDQRVEVIEDGCVGCGVCQHRCPTTPKSIMVEPKASRI
jgi:ferredoxin-type protein NapG